MIFDSPESKMLRYFSNLEKGRSDTAYMNNDYVKSLYINGKLDPSLLKDFCVSQRNIMSDTEYETAKTTLSSSGLLAVNADGEPRIPQAGLDLAAKINSEFDAAFTQARIRQNDEIIALNKQDYGVK